MLAHTSIDHPEQLDWLDRLPHVESDSVSLAELVERLRDLRYEVLADYIAPLLSRRLKPHNPQQL